MSLNQPNTVLSKLSVENKEKAVTTARIAGADATLEVSFFSKIGWSFEVRADQKIKEIIRQPFTGVQENLKLCKLSVSSNADTVTVKVEDEDQKAEISIEDGSLRLWQGDLNYFDAPAPFRMHLEPVSIQEDIKSAQKTSWNEPTPWRLTPAFFDSYVVQFLYPQASGPIIGLAGQSGELDRRGYRFELFNSDEMDHAPSRKPMYQSWPIVFHKAHSSNKWLAIFHDNPSRTWVDCGDFYPDQVVFESVTNNPRVNIISGSSLTEVASKLVNLLGTPELPPAWAFGYQQSRYSYMSTNEIRTVVNNFASAKIPLDALYFDIDYMDGYRVFTTNSKSFGDLVECLDELSQQNIKSICIVDPGVKKDPELELYNKLVKNDQVLTNESGLPFEALTWPGRCVLPDFFESDARETWIETQDAWLRKYKFDGIWNDMNEPSNFDGGSEKTEQANTRAGLLKNRFNIYGYAMAMTSTQGWQHTHSDKRGLIVTRSGYPGIQRHAVVWHGDNSGWWEHIRLAIDLAIEFSLGGVFYNGPDLPGFFENAPKDLAVRFFQLGSFLPFFRGHSYKLANYKEPYTFTGKTGELIKEAILLRYSLAREWYSQFERSIRSSTPPIVPVFDDQGEIIRDGFMLFDIFLVMPIAERGKQFVSIYLPDGVWYRLGEINEKISGNKWIHERITADRIPVFVRGGTILTRNTPKMTMEATLAAPEHFEVYPDENGEAEGYWYSDDFNSRNPKIVKRLKTWINKDGEVVKEEL